MYCVGVVESLKVITREKSLRIAKFAFDYALRHNRYELKTHTGSRGPP